MTILNRGKSAGIRTLASSILTRWAHKKPGIPHRPEILPVKPGVYVQMAYPPPGGTIVKPGPSGYERVNVRPDWITDDSDLWQYPDDWLAGEYECVLSAQRPDGTATRTRDIVEWAVELKASCPAAYTRLRLAMAEEALDQTGAEILN